MVKKGFTLIELLAVIIIIGVIVVITIPTVVEVIGQSKKKAFEINSNNIVSVIENNCQSKILKSESIITTYTFTDGVVSPTLNIKGKLPTAGTATVDSDCKVELNITNGEFTATKTTLVDIVTVVDGGEITPTTYTVYANGTAIYFNPETGATCTSGEAVSTTGTKTGCMK